MYIGAATVEAVQAAWPLVENLVDVVRRKHHAFWYANGRWCGEASEGVRGREGGWLVDWVLLRGLGHAPLVHPFLFGACVADAARVSVRHREVSALCEVSGRCGCPNSPGD